MLTRRQLFKTGLVGGMAVLAAGWLAAPAADPAPSAVSSSGLRFLTPLDAVIVRALAPVLLGQPDVPRDEVVRGVDQAVAGLPPAVQREVRLLFDLLANRWARRYLLGVAVPWSQAGAAELSAFLRSWQISRLQWQRTGYQALHALIAAAWFGNPASWPALGYTRPAYVLERLP
ncbi:MAG TPA: hypothetical protein VJ642_02205 [Chromobacteriaceae bacterium]|nr:hypothetical protein [Chromobacteriaceae bacterium]